MRTPIVLLFAAATLLAAQPASAKKKKATPAKPAGTDSIGKAAGGILPYKKVITDAAITRRGLLTVHMVGDKWYFEIPDSLFGREMMLTTRFAKIAGGGGTYAGEMESRQSVIWERGPYRKVFLRVVTTLAAADTASDIYKAVSASNLSPIAGAFDIRAFSKDSARTVIEVTDFFKSEAQPVALGPGTKRRFNLGTQAADKTFIQTILSFPVNTEVKVVRTYASTPPQGPPSPGSPPSTTLPAAVAAGNVTVEMNNSFVLLPRVPMMRRYYDPRVGYFSDDFVTYADEQQKAEPERFIVRWRLEPKPEDRARFLRGELVEPARPIVYYIDPATPKKWRPYLMQGVTDWQVAFEAAGFKNAIQAKEWPADSSMSLEDARFSVIRYLPSDIENAYGPNVHDPRSGEIIESHIGWYHNVMKLLHDWYLIQAAGVDPRARRVKFDDLLMGQLIRFVSAHEVGHTLGLRHNMGSSSRTPVALLRNKAWVEAHGHTASIMDYARFNYVAQPEDSIGAAGIFPRIGEYDCWAIQWGYRPTGAKDPKADRQITNRWVIDSVRENPRLWFGTESNPFDPRSQTEDLGDNAVEASRYGLKNLKRILARLPEYAYEEADKFENLDDLYAALVSQFGRYNGHVLKSIGGITETPRSVEEEGVVYAPVSAGQQREALRFLHAELFRTPTWLLDRDVLDRTTNPLTLGRVAAQQTSTLANLMSAARLSRMVASQARFGEESTWGADALMDEITTGLWAELSTRAPADPYRRGLQQAHVDALIALCTPGSDALKPYAVPGLGTVQPSADVASLARAQLVTLKVRLAAAIPGTTDKLTRYHLQDALFRITKALDPRG